MAKPEEQSPDEHDRAMGGLSAAATRRGIGPPAGRSPTVASSCCSRRIVCRCSAWCASAATNSRRKPSARQLLDGRPPAAGTGRRRTGRPGCRGRSRSRSRHRGAVPATRVSSDELASLPAGAASGVRAAASSPLASSSFGASTMTGAAGGQVVEQPARPGLAALSRLSVQRQHEQLVEHRSPTAERSDRTGGSTRCRPRRTPGAPAPGARG